MASPARFWHQQEDGRIQCDLCPRHCRMREGQRAFCFVRQVENGQLVLSTYGKSTGFCIDPIEKKPLNHFYPGTPVLSFGTAGCNLGCRFCQNWNISKSKEVARLSEDASPEAIAQAAAHHGCKSVAFTYNDPVIWAEYAIDTAVACHALDVKTVAVTAGYIGDKAREAFFQHIDAANIDLKAFTETFYHKLCFAHLGPVLDTLIWLKQETQVWFEVTTLLIPGHNDSEEEIHQLCSWFAEHLGAHVPLHFTAFHPDFKMRDTPRMTRAQLRQARRIAQEYGLHYVYTGNVHDIDGDATFCPRCKERVIQRSWYNLERWTMDDGRCGSCNTPIAGVFSPQPGDWGARREPIGISAAVD